MKRKWIGIAIGGLLMVLAGCASGKTQQEDVPHSTIGPDVTDITETDKPEDDVTTEEQKFIIRPEDRRAYKQITCHDPSVFKDFDGTYEIILHELNIVHRNLETKQPQSITLKEDGTITGDYEGTWKLEPGTSYISLSFNGQEYSGVSLSMDIEYTTIKTDVFTAVGLSNQVTLWGSKTE